MNSCIKIAKLYTERLVLEPLEMSHAQGLFKVFSDNELYTYINREAPKSQDEFKSFIERITRGGSADGKQIWLNWVSKDNLTGELVGFFEGTVMSGETLLAYYTFRPYWKCGFAKEGVAAVMNFLKNEYSTKKFVLEMDTRNRASVGLAESLGFKWISTKNNADYFKESQSHEFRYEYSADYQKSLEGI